MEKTTSISLTGHRPKELFGYNIDSQEYDSIRTRLATILKGFVLSYDEVTCHTGMALGADTIWADVSLLAKKKWPNKVKLWAEIPHPFQKDAWKSQQARLHYDYIIENIDEKTVYSDEYSPWCMQKRNEGMLDAGKELIAVWNGTLRMKSGTSNAIKYAIKTKDGYFVVRPNDELIRWDLSNAMLTSTRGHNVYDEQLVKNYLLSIIEEYKENGFNEIKKGFLKKDNDIVMVELIKEVEYETKTKKYSIFTIKEYKLFGRVFKNIKNHTFIKN